MAGRKEVMVVQEEEIKTQKLLVESRKSSKEELMSRFLPESLLIEGKEIAKGEAEVIAEAIKPNADKLGNAKADKGSRTYSLTYYNPETHKAEVIEGQTDIRMRDPTLAAAEESVGLGSAYPIYSFIASPLIRIEVVQWRLEEILNEREYGTPPESGSASMIKVSKIEQKSADIVALKAEVIAREALIIALERKEDSEKKIEYEIRIFEETIDSVKKGEPIAQAIRNLPPLSRARYLVLLKKKKLQEKIVLGMLSRELNLLKAIKKKLEALTPKELLAIVSALKKIMKK
jgi:hypothetical protein